MALPSSPAREIVPTDYGTYPCPHQPTPKRCTPNCHSHSKQTVSFASPRQNKTLPDISTPVPSTHKSPPFYEPFDEAISSLGPTSHPHWSQNTFPNPFSQAKVISGCNKRTYNQQKLSNQLAKNNSKKAPKNLFPSQPPWTSPQRKNQPTHLPTIYSSPYTTLST